MKNFFESIRAKVWFWFHRKEEIRREDHPKLFCLIDYVRNKKNGIQQDRIEDYEQILKDGGSPWYTPLENE
jgi:hypothetical protein